MQRARGGEERCSGKPTRYFTLLYFRCIFFLVKPHFGIKTPPPPFSPCLLVRADELCSAGKKKTFNMPSKNRCSEGRGEQSRALCAGPHFSHDRYSCLCVEIVVRGWLEFVTPRSSPSETSVRHARLESQNRPLKKGAPRQRDRSPGVRVPSYLGTHGRDALAHTRRKFVREDSGALARCKAR